MEASEATGEATFGYGLGDTNFLAFGDLNSPPILKI